jgi:DNA replication protein DnaC
MTTTSLQPMPELAPLLKRLRLSGVLESLPERNRQALDQQLSHTEFLALLVQDEVARRDHKKFALRVRRAGFGPQKTLEHFDFAWNRRLDQTLLRDLATCRFVAEKVAVLIAGPCGTGKSHIAQALGHEAVRHGYDVLFTTQSRLLGQLQQARATQTFERRFQALVRVPLLIIDDFGLKPLQPTQDDDFHELVAERYERAASIVTSNLAFEEWGTAFSNRLLAAATLDRLRDGAYCLVLDGDSHRTPRTALKPAIARPGKEAK